MRQRYFAEHSTIDHSIRGQLGMLLTKPLFTCGVISFFKMFEVQLFKCCEDEATDFVRWDRFFSLLFFGVRRQTRQ